MATSTVVTTPKTSSGTQTPNSLTKEKDLGLQSSVSVSASLPSPRTLEECAKLPIYDADGKERSFASLYTGPGATHRTLIIFVRHFLCGNCQDYLRALSAALPPSALPSSPSTSISVIGCGEPSLIASYAQSTSCPYAIYSDPSRRLYDALGLTRTLALGKRPGYMSRGLGRAALDSVAQALTLGRRAMGAGDMRQVGGEMLFERQGEVEWCHRMRNTRDHAEIEEIERVLLVRREPAPVA